MAARPHVALVRHLQGALAPLPPPPSSSLTTAALSLAPSSSEVNNEASTTSSAVSSSTAYPFSPSEYRKFPLIARSAVSHNTHMFRFGLPSAQDTVNLPIGQHIFLQAEIEGKKVFRSYTPVTLSDDRGYFDLVIKVYPDGKMSSYVDNLPVGSTIDVKGPKGKFKYERGMKERLGMIAGGTGITPMLQIIRAIARDPQDTTTVNLLFGNVTEGDILFRTELSELASSPANAFTVDHVLNNPPESWKGYSGFVTKAIIEERLPPPSPSTMILLCGPPPMIKAMIKILSEIGHAPEAIFAF